MEGDINKIIDDAEKLGGLLVTQQKTIDFVSCVSSFTLNKLKFIESCYTWWNGIIEEDCIFKRLDRFLGIMNLCSYFRMVKFIT